MATDCKICSLKCKNDSILLSHINIHIGRKCKICDTIFKSETSKPTDTPIPNTTCIESHEWLSKQSQRRHLQISDNTISYDNNYQLRTATTANSDWHCQFCEYKTCSKHRLTKHMRTHTNERPFKCEDCGRRFTVSCNLKQHIQSIHTKVKPFTCSTCSLGFIRKDKLREHERIHTGEKPYECEFCAQAFARRSSLNKHIKIHIGFKCRFCQKTFESEAKLRSHKKEAHKDVNPETGTKWFKFGCNLCQKRFFTQKLLKEHLALHKGYPCNECCNVFETDDAIRAHKCIKMCQKIETMKPLKMLQDKIAKDRNRKHHCFECDKYFKSGSALGGHRSRVHSRKRKPTKKKKVTAKRKKTEKSDDNEGDNALDELVREHVLKKQIEKEKNVKKKRNHFGVDIFGDLHVQKDAKAKDKMEKIQNQRTTRSKRKKERKTLKDCPARHGLKKQLTPNNRVFECDECQKTMFLNEEMFGCRYCNFDLCVSCYLGPHCEPWMVELYVDHVSVMKVSIDKTDLDPEYKCDKMIWYKQSGKEKRGWCEYIQHNDEKNLSAQFMEYIDVKCEHDTTQLNDGVFINPTVFNGDIVAIKVLPTKYASHNGGVFINPTVLNDDTTIKAVLIKMQTSNVPSSHHNHNSESMECKTLTYDTNDNKQNRVNPRPKIILSLRRKRTRNVNGAQRKQNEPIPKKRKLTIKIPRLKKTNQ